VGVRWGWRTRTRQDGYWRARGLPG
jgi:hypothetical protein